MYAANILRHTGAEAAIIAEYRGMAERPGAHLAARRLRRRRLAYVSSGTDIGLVKPCKPLIGAMPDRRLTAPYTLNGALTEVRAADLGITVHYEPGDYLWTIV